MLHQLYPKQLMNVYAYDVVITLTRNYHNCTCPKMHGYTFQMCKYYGANVTMPINSKALVQCQNKLQQKIIYKTGKENKLSMSKAEEQKQCQNISFKKKEKKRKEKIMLLVFMPHLYMLHICFEYMNGHLMIIFGEIIIM